MLSSYRLISILRSINVSRLTENLIQKTQQYDPKTGMPIAYSAGVFLARDKYFFAKCVVALLDSQSRGRLGRDRKRGGRYSLVYNANLRSLTRRPHCRLECPGNWVLKQKRLHSDTDNTKRRINYNLNLYLDEQIKFVNPGFTCKSPEDFSSVNLK